MTVAEFSRMLENYPDDAELFFNDTTNDIGFWLNGVYVEPLHVVEKRNKNHGELSMSMNILLTETQEDM